MTQRDIDWIKILHKAIERKITQKKAGELLGLCRGQANRLYQKIKKKGDRAIRGAEAVKVAVPRLVVTELLFIYIGKHYYQ